MVYDSITVFEYIEYLPNDCCNINKFGEHKIDTRDLYEYLLPYKTMLEGRVKLVKAADNFNFAVTDVVKLVNNGWSLIRSIQYQIDGHLVEYVNQCLPQASAIVNFVQFSDDYARSTATNMLLYRDNAMAVRSITSLVFLYHPCFPPPLAARLLSTPLDTLSI